MSRFHIYIFYAFLFSLSLTSCSGPDDRDAYLASLNLSEGELTPVFTPRTKIYDSHVNCSVASIDINAPAAYPGLNSVIVDAVGDNLTTVNLELGLDNIINIELSGETFIPTTYTLTVTRGGEFDPPAITIIGDVITIATLNVKYDDPGANACDGLGNDISSDIISSGAEDVDYETLGTYIVTYDVKDSNNVFATQVIRTVTVVTNTAPTITLVGNATETIAVGSVFSEVDPGATASDEQEGDITDKITHDGETQVNTSIPDDYIVTYTVKDTGGLSASISRTFIVE